MAFVLDSSVTLAWLLLGGAGVARTSTNWRDRLGARVFVIVPSIWALEVGRRIAGGTAAAGGGSEDDELARLAAALDGLPIEVDQEAAKPAFLTILTVAKKLGLTTYDAAYIELAHRHALPLATLDDRLRAACGNAGPGAALAAQREYYSTAQKDPTLSKSPTGSGDIGRTTSRVTICFK